MRASFKWKIWSLPEPIPTKKKYQPQKQKSQIKNGAVSFFKRPLAIILSLP